MASKTSCVNKEMYLFLYRMHLRTGQDVHNDVDEGCS